MLARLRAIRCAHGEDLYLDTPVAYRHLGASSVCPALRLSIDVGCDGTLRPCKFSRLSLGTIQDLGQVWDRSGDIWSRCGECLRCKDHNRCGGGCLANKADCTQRDHYCSLVNGDGGACPPEAPRPPSPRT
jgi:radical SAM protein with 4Fe4S-binding SPASM domain